MENATEVITSNDLTKAEKNTKYRRQPTGSRYRDEVLSSLRCPLRTEMYLEPFGTIKSVQTDWNMLMCILNRGNYVRCLIIRVLLALRNSLAV